MEEKLEQSSINWEYFSDLFMQLQIQEHGCMLPEERQDAKSAFMKLKLSE